MPPRLRLSRHSLRQPLLILDLHVLPFLASRAFAPLPTALPHRRLATKILSNKSDAVSSSAKAWHSPENEVSDDVSREQEADRMAMADVIRAIESGSYESISERQRSSTLAKDPCMETSQGGDLKLDVNFPQGTDLDSAYKMIWGSEDSELQSSIPCETTSQDSTETSKSSRMNALYGVSVAVDHDPSKQDEGDHVCHNGSLAAEENPTPTRFKAMFPRINRIDEDITSCKQLQTSHQTERIDGGTGKLPLLRKPLPAIVRKRAERTVLSRDGLLKYNVPDVRSHYVALQLDPNKPNWSSTRLWRAGMARLNLWFDPKLQDQAPLFSTHESMRERLASAKVKTFVRKLASASSAGDVRQIWREYCSRATQKDSKHDFWAMIMLETLQNFPDSGLKILLGTFDTPSVPPYAISDCLDYMTSFFLQQKGVSQKSRSSSASIIKDIVRLLLFQDAKEKIDITQKTLYLLAENLPGSDLTELYDDLRASKQFIHRNTSLQFTHALAKQGNADKAMHVLQRLNNEGLDFADPVVGSVCATILRMHGASSDSEVFAKLLNMGLQPNIIFYNILLHNAAQHGDHETAWRIYDMMIDINATPDEYSYSILLNDAKRRLDKDAMNRLFKIVQSENIRNSHIVTEFLHATFEIHVAEQHRNKHLTGHQSSRGSNFGQMLPLFAAYFETDAIELLLPSEVFENLPPNTIQPKLPPSVPSLVVILIAYLRQVKSSSEPLRFYEVFRGLVLARHPLIVPLAETSHVYDTVIASLGSWFEMVPICGKIVADMLSRNPKATIIGEMPQKAIERHADAPRVSHCLPSVYTWSILVKIFQDHRQPRAAESVIEIMAARDTQPNAVTWNTLVQGYCQMQDISNAVGTLERMDAAGIRIDQTTMKSLQWIKHRARLQKALESMALRKRHGIGGKSPRLVVDSVRAADDATDSLAVDESMNGLTLDAAVEALGSSTKKIQWKNKRKPKVALDRSAMSLVKNGKELTNPTTDLNVESTMPQRHVT